MNHPFVIAGIVFLAVFGGGLLGLSLRKRLPEHHLSDESVGMVKLGTGLIATLVALVLGLLTASAKASYDRVNDEVQQTAGKIVLLDRTLAQYGPQTQELRGILHAQIASLVETMTSPRGHALTELDAPQRLANAEKMQSKLLELKPENDTQRMLQGRALGIANDLAQTRWLLIAQGESSLPRVFLVVLVLWFLVMFTGFGLSSVRNSTVIATLFLCALSLSGSVLLIEEMNRPLQGLMRVSPEPMRNALAHLGQ